jgi:transcriptional regulator with XRE-family HTH domain
VFVKVAERDLARRLRREQGLPIKTIAATIGVSSSSVSRWVRDIELTPEHAAALRDANPIYNRQRSGTARSSANARARRVAAQQAGARLAQAGDPLHQHGCMLYWAEGARSRNQLAFTNSDPEMVELFVHFLRRCYGVSDERIALRVNVHLGNGLTLEEIEAWWLQRLGLPPGSLRRAMVNRPSRISQRKRRTLPYGTVRIVVSSTALVQNIFGAIQAYAGLQRPNWLG